MYKSITACRICGSSDLVEVFSLGEQCLTGVFPRSREVDVPKGPLVLVRCSGPRACGLVQLAHSFQPELMYGDNYGYRSGLNASMVRHLHAKIERLRKQVEARADDLVLDIGSNDGTTLAAYKENGLVKVGIDPTAEKFRKYYEPGIHIVTDFFSARTFDAHFPGRQAMAITSFSMLYDLESPLRFVLDVAKVLAPDGLWMFEQSYMPTMLKENAYDTICHEHLEYYSLKQIDWLLREAGLKIVDVEFNDVNGGSFSVIAAHAASSRGEFEGLQGLLDQERALRLDSSEPYLGFSQRVRSERDRLVAWVSGVRHSGRRVVALGASTKGNVILQYCGFDDTIIEAVGEVNEDKFGAFTPGSVIPIVEEARLFAQGFDHALVLPWHFKPHFLQKYAAVRDRLVFPLPQVAVGA